MPLPSLPLGLTRSARVPGVAPRPPRGGLRSALFTRLVGLCFLLLGVVPSVLGTPADGIYPMSVVSSTVSYTLIKQAAAAYAVANPGFSLSTTSFASTASVMSAYLGGAYDFVMATAPLTPVQRGQNPQYKEFPVIANAVVPIYNLPNAGTAQLVMPIQVMCDIELGVVTNWNDTRLQAANPDLVLPDLGITIYHLSIASSTNEMIASMCGKINPAFKVAIPRSQSPSWPSKKYFKASTGASSDILASNVVEVVGAYAMATLQNVLAIKAKIAAIKTMSGDVLNPTVNAISLNVLELATIPLKATDSGYDLTNPQTPGAWPICTMLSLTIDAVNPMTTCATKTLMMKFLVWFYTSTTVKALANTLNMAIVPELFLTQTGLLDTLQSTIQCAGQPMISSATSNGFVQGFSGIQSLLTAYSNFYQQANTDYAYSFQASTESLATQRVVAGEIDLALVNTRQLTADDVQMMTQDDGGIFAPAFYTGVVVTFTLPSMIVTNYSKWNALTDTRGGLPQLLPLALSLETVAGIFTGQITSWTDPAMVKDSPQLQPWFDAHPTAKTAFKPVVCCTNPAAQQAAGVLLLQSLNQTAIAKTPAFKKFFTLPVSWSEQIKSSPAFTNIDLEARMSPKSISVQNSGLSTISYRLINTAASDPASEFRILQTAGGKAEAVSAQPSNFVSCARVGWATKQLTSPSWNPGPIGGCYPLAAPMSFGLGMVYVGQDECTRGNHSLNYFAWINSNSALSNAALSSGVLRVSDLPEVQTDIATTLNTATCDGQTLLITLPKVWELSPAIAGFGLAVMVILLVVFAASAVVLVLYRQRTVLRSSSVPFLGLILFGLSMIAISIALWSTSAISESTCGGFVWMASFGFSLVFVPFFVKTWRVYKIFSRQKLQVIKLSNRKLGLLVGFFFLGELVVMLTWSEVSPLRPVTYLRNIGGRMHQATLCSVEGSGMTFIVVETVYKGALLVVGSLLAFRTRKVSSSFNESSSIAMSIYSCLFSSIIIGALVYFVSAFEDTLILLMLFLLFWLALVTWALVFGAKFYELFSRTEADAAQASKIESLQTEKSQGGFSFVSVAAMPLPLIRTYVQALEAQLAKARRQMTILIGSTFGMGGTAGTPAPLGGGVTLFAGGVGSKRALQVNPPMANKQPAAAANATHQHHLPGEATGGRGSYSPSDEMTIGSPSAILGDESTDALQPTTVHMEPIGRQSSGLLQPSGTPRSDIARAFSDIPRSPSQGGQRAYQPPMQQGWTNGLLTTSPTGLVLHATPVTPSRIQLNPSKSPVSAPSAHDRVSQMDLTERPKASERKPILIGQKESIEGGDAGSPASSVPPSVTSSGRTSPTMPSTIAAPAAFQPDAPVAAAPAAVAVALSPTGGAHKVSPPAGPVSTALRPSSRATVAESADSTLAKGTEETTKPPTTPK